MAEIIQKRDVVRAKDLNIVVYEDPSMSEGLSYKFDAQVALDVGCEPVFTESLDELAQAIDHMETLPDAIIIKDKSTPSVRDVMPEIAFSDALNRFSRIFFLQPFTGGFLMLGEAPELL